MGLKRRLDDVENPAEPNIAFWNFGLDDVLSQKHEIWILDPKNLHVSCLTFDDRFGFIWTKLFVVLRILKTLYQLYSYLASGRWSHRTWKDIEGCQRISRTWSIIWKWNYLDFYPNLNLMSTIIILLLCIHVYPL